MPNFDGAATVEAAIRSGLAQTYVHLEMIVVDDGSRDDSLARIESLARTDPRVRVLTHLGRTNRGLVATYERALREARGEIVAFLESDDLWEPENLARKIDALVKHPEVGVVHSDFLAFGERGGALYWNLYGRVNRAATPRGTPYAAFPVLLLRNSIPSYTHFAVRRRLLDGVPPSPVARNCDWWALAHLATRAPFLFLPEKLTRWRIHRASAHYGPAKVPLGEVEGFRRSLHDALSRTPEVEADARLREALERARTFSDGIDPGMLDGGRRFVRALRTRPGLAVSLGIDTVLRRLAFRG